MATPALSTEDRPVAAVMEPLVRRLLGGSLPLALRCWDGSTIGPSDAPATIVLRSPDALRRLLYAPNEIGLVRAYVAGELDLEGDVFALLQVRDLLGRHDEHVDLDFGLRSTLELFRAARRLDVLGPPLAPPPEEVRLGGRRHSRARDARAVSHHYDVGNAFYRLFLGKSLTYSCAYWDSPDANLDDAQRAKYELICRKLGLRPGMRLLDVGCGWGGMVIHAAEHHGVSAVGVTVSREQQRLATDRVEAAGLSHRVEIRDQDYRQVADGPYDAISSIGMFEHVGMEQAREYFGDLRSLLRPEGRLLNHAITRTEPASKPSIDRKSFVGRYVFPDSALIEVGSAISAMQETGFEVRDVESLREHYARTLRAWVDNLEAHWDEAQRLVGSPRARIWRLYLAGSAVGFEQNRISVHQVLAVRPTTTGESAMPATRTWLASGAAARPATPLVIRTPVHAER